MDTKKMNYYKLPKEAFRIDKFMLNGREVSVIRGDLVGDGNEYPRWGKIEAIDKLLMSNAIDKNKPLVHLSVYGSWTGWTLSKLCPMHDIEYISAYPDSKSYPPELLQRIKENGATMFPLKPNMMALMENKLKGINKKKGWQMLPHAFNHPVYVKYMQDKMEEIMKINDFDHLIIGIGSGVTAAGLIKGFLKYDNWKDIVENKRQVHSITMSTINSTRKILNKNYAGDKNNIHLYKPEFDFNDMMEDYIVPFDCNEFWEKKSWKWLDQNIHKLKGKIAFFSLGGSYQDSIKYLRSTQNKKE